MKLDLAELVKYNVDHGKPTELSHDQFLSLTLKQNHIPKNHFSTDVLGLFDAYLSNNALHAPHNHLNKNAPAKGFRKEQAEKLAPLFDEPPYNTAEFWMLGTHMIKSLEEIPLINKTMLPPNVKRHSYGEKPSINTVDGPFINEGKTTDTPSKGSGERTV